MRTTIDIPDAMYRRLMARAAAESRSVTAVILQGIEHALTSAAPPARTRVTLPLVKSKRPRSIRIDHTRVYDIVSFP